MILANTSVVVGKTAYQKGQAVSGLSDLDKNWMLAAGYISEKRDTAKGDSKGRQNQKLADDSAECAVASGGE